MILPKSAGLVRLAVLCVALGLGACTPAPPDGPTQLQMQTDARLRSLGIRNANLDVVSTSDLITINDIMSERIRYGQKRSRVEFILRNAGAI